MSKVAWSPWRLPRVATWLHELWICGLAMSFSSGCSLNCVCAQVALIVLAEVTTGIASQTHHHPEIKIAINVKTWVSPRASIWWAEIICQGCGQSRTVQKYPDRSRRPVVAHIAWHVLCSAGSFEAETVHTVIVGCVSYETCVSNTVSGHCESVQKGCSLTSAYALITQDQNSVQPTCLHCAFCVHIHAR